MYALGHPVKLALARDNQFVPVKGRVIGRTWSETPSYDVVCEDDTLLTSVPGAFVANDAAEGQGVSQAEASRGRGEAEGRERADVRGYVRAVPHTPRNAARADGTQHLAYAHGIVARTDLEVADPALALAQLVLQLTKAVLVGRPPDQDETA